jgi:hypothetical protein
VGLNGTAVYTGGPGESAVPNEAGAAIEWREGKRRVIRRTYPMSVVKAEFDGRVFVPCEPLNLPAGTRVEVIVPGPPPKLTPEEAREWQEILQQIAATEPPFPTVEEAMRYTRKRP